MKKLILFFLLFITTVAYNQKNFTFTPEKPRAGDLINITYEPAGDIAKTTSPIEGLVHLESTTGSSVDDLVFKKEGKKYIATVKTDTSTDFVYFAFTADKKFDNNFNDGYWIQLYDGDSIRKGSYRGLSNFYSYNSAGVERNSEKALQYMEKDFLLNPGYKKTVLPYYARLLTSAKKAEAVPILQQEIEGILKDGVKEEQDYDNLEQLYTAAKLPEQAKFVAAAKKEKFPNGKWVVSQQLSKYAEEKDIEKKEQLIDEIIKKTASDSNWKFVKESLPYYTRQIATAYSDKKDWEGFKKALAKYGSTPKENLASFYNNTAWEMQKTSENLQYAEEISRFATMHAKDEWLKPTATKPVYFSKKQWDRQREFTYAMYADTYAMVLYRMGQYKKGYPYAKDAAIKIHKGNDAEGNFTYAQLAEKVLPVKTYKKELEQFVKDGKSTSGIVQILKTAYTKEKKSEAGFEEYITRLEKESYEKMLAELRKSMLDETTPSFALLDLQGNKVDINDLKGKVVVVDFWATWCGPCVASFPGMQKMVNKYKDNPGVRFVFVDTWEQGNEKEKKAADFLAANKYNFQVLMDNDNEVVQKFKVDGIPTKFVIDKEGKIRYKSVGYNGSDDKLVSELTAMIEMAGGTAKNAF